VAGALDGGVEDTLEAELVALQRGDGLAEELLGVDVAGVDTRDVDLLPLNGNVVRLEDLLDRLGDLSTDTVTGDQGDGVLAAELGGLEDVLADGSEGCMLLEVVIEYMGTRDGRRVPSWRRRTSSSHRRASCALGAPQKRLAVALALRVPFCLNGFHRRMSVPAQCVERSWTTCCAAFSGSCW
jgi:hypothetical protein